MFSVVSCWPDSHKTDTEQAFSRFSVDNQQTLSRQDIHNIFLTLDNIVYWVVNLSSDGADLVSDKPLGLQKLLQFWESYVPEPMFVFFFIDFIIKSGCFLSFLLAKHKTIELSKCKYVNEKNSLRNEIYLADSKQQTCTYLCFLLQVQVDF